MGFGDERADGGRRPVKDQEVIEYACPECGHDGPHPVIGIDFWLDPEVECIGCYGEFSATKDRGADAPHRCDTGHFDRTLCPDPCDMMHSYCATCGERQDPCAHDAS